MAGGGGRSNIKLFKFIQQTYKFIGIHPPKPNRNRSPFNSINWLILCSLAQLFLTSSAAYVVFEANTMIEYGMAFFIGTTTLLSITFYLISLCQMQNILDFIESCERFIEKRRLHSTIAYEDANEKIERLTEIFAYASIVSEIIYVLLPLFYTIDGYYILVSGTESFFLFYPTWWPFDWRTPLGYLVAWLAQCVGVGAIIIAVIPFFNVIFASSWLFIVIAEDLTRDVTAFNQYVVNTLKDSDRSKRIERLHIFIQHYSDAKQCVDDFNHISKYSLFAFFLWYMLTVASLLVPLQFQLWDNNSKLFEIMILSTLIAWIFVLDLATCEAGDRVTKQFDQFGVELDQCKWNNLPIEMQRMYLIFLSDTQQSKYIQSYAGISCTRQTFKQITTKGFSYFMTLRNFGE